MPADLLGRVRQRLAGEGAGVSSATVARAVRAEAGLLVSDAQMLDLIRAFHCELVGTGPLAALLADPDTTDVIVNGPDDVRVDRGRGWESTEVRFADDEAVTRLARRLAVAAGRRLDDAQPFVDADLPDGSRLHAVLAPPAASGTCLSIRTLRPSRHGMDSLAAGGTFPGLVRPVLEAIILARCPFLISGGTGTGKTTLLGAMLGAVPPTERIVTVEDSAELRPEHPHVVRLVARTDNVEGAGRIELRELVRQALRMRPDRLVVGEVRGAEIIDLLSALNTGHEGGAGTVHANAVMEVPARMEALGSLGGLDRYALHAQLAGALRVVVHLRRGGGPARGAAGRVRAAGEAGRTVAGVGVLTMGSRGLMVPATAIDDAGRPTEHAGLLAGILRERGVAVPW
ncbi:TadA family conjugal transfer-associated ATPase [Nakamurella silvestris]|nr:TadA family conjugal transfer-associated ATPase [Nakamurella silvestris]